MIVKRRRSRINKEELVEEIKPEEIKPEEHKKLVLDPDELRDAIAEFKTNPARFTELMEQFRGNGQLLRKLFLDLIYNKSEMEKMGKDPFVLEQLEAIKIFLENDPTWSIRFTIDIFMIMLGFIVEYLPFVFGEDYAGLGEIAGIILCGLTGWFFVGWTAVIGLFGCIVSANVAALICAVFVPTSFLFAHWTALGILTKAVAMIIGVYICNYLNRPYSRFRDHHKIDNKSNNNDNNDNNIN